MGIRQTMALTSLNREEEANTLFSGTIVALGGYRLTERGETRTNNRVEA